MKAYDHIIASEKKNIAFCSKDEKHGMLKNDIEKLPLKLFNPVPSGPITPNALLWNLSVTYGSAYKSLHLQGRCCPGQRCSTFPVVNGSS